MRFLSLITLLLVCLSAQAINNPKVAIESTDNFALHKANNANIQSITESNDALDGVVDNYQTCIDKGLIYLGSGASNVDADNCYDVANTTNPDTRFRVTLAGILSSGQQNGSQGGRFAVDKLCNSEYAGSRALVLSDLPHAFPLLNVALYTGSYQTLWVYDSYTRANHAVSNPTCNGWSSSSSSYVGATLEQTSGVYDFRTNQTCNSNAFIMCVYN